jgi:hypothetical protein
MYGAALASDGSVAADTWQAIVDRLSAELEGLGLVRGGSRSYD